MLAVALLFAFGLVAGLVAKPPAEAHRALEWLVQTIGLPALILARLAPARLGPSALVPAAVAWSFVGVWAGLVVWFGRGRLSRGQMGALLLLVPIGNTSFLGLPAVRAIAGDRAVPTVLLYDQLGTYLALATYGAVVVAVLSSGSRPKPVDVGRRIVSFPPFLATAVALPIAVVCSAADVDFQWPAAVGTALDYAGAAVAPAALWAVALRAVRTSWQRPDALLIGTLVAKMVLAPAVVLAAVCIVGIARTYELNVSILELAMPSSVAASAIAADAGFEPALCARATAAGLVLSFATLPLWGAVLGW